MTRAKGNFGLNAALAAGRDPETLEAARALVDKVIIHPPETDDDPPRIELVGDLMVMLQAGGVGRAQAKVGVAAYDRVLGLFVSSVKEGPGAKPWAFCFTRLPRGRGPHAIPLPRPRSARR
jgi:site-specific DNA recombinase